MLVGTEGDDTLPVGQDRDLVPEEINLLGGDDTAILEDQIGVGVSGGEGNDTLTSTDGGTVLYGNAGDNILTGIGGNNLFGGAGDDQIISNPSDNAFDTTVQIDGGEGNDTISIFADAGIENFFNLGSAVATGGDGADEFNVVYDLQNSMGEEQFLDTSLLRITDFNPNEDVLTIEVDRNDETTDRSVEVELDQTQENGTYTSLITLTFVEEVNATQAVANLTVISNAAFTLDDIRLFSI